MTKTLSRQRACSASPGLVTMACRCWSRYSCLLVSAASHWRLNRSRSLSYHTHKTIKAFLSLSEHIYIFLKTSAEKELSKYVMHPKPHNC